MKRYIIAFVMLSVVAAVTSVSLFGRDRREKSFEALWAEYEHASDYDRPRKAESVLEEIIRKARNEHEAWHFYHAWDRYIDVRSERDWKAVPELYEQRMEEMESFGEPLLVFLCNLYSNDFDKSFAELQGVRAELAGHYNPDVYEGAGALSGSVVNESFTNDYQYALWRVFELSLRDTEYRRQMYGIVCKEFGDAYPVAGIAEYLYLISGKVEEAGLYGLASRYEGRALSLLPLQYLVKRKLLADKDKGTSEDYRKMREQVKGYIKLRDGFRSGVDARIAAECEGLDDVLKHLDEENVTIWVHDGRLYAAFRNMSKAKVAIIHEGDKVFDTVIENTERSYYLRDTVSVDLPPMPDGDYTIRYYESVASWRDMSYLKYTLSAAVREDAGMKYLYVADYMTGEPVEVVDIEVNRNDRKVAEYKDFRMDGFTELPQEILSAIESKGYCNLRCVAVGEDGLTRMSRNVYVPKSSGRYVSSGPDPLLSVVLTERAAYRPGEVLKFKAIVYGQDLEKKLSYVSEGVSVTVRLVDQQGDAVWEKVLNANEFGSVAAECELEGLKRMGMHSLEVLSGNKVLGQTSVVIEEYVLPTFDLTFDKPSKAYFPGDDITVCGKVKSLSGTPMSASAMVAEVSLKGNVILQEKIVPEHDGRFSFTFADVHDEDDWFRDYQIEVKVTDPTGETHSFDFVQRVLLGPSLSVEVTGSEDGTFRMTDDGVSGFIVGKKKVGLNCMVSAYSGVVLGNVPLRYALEKDGVVLREGEVCSGGVVDLNFSDLPSGRYDFKLSLEIESSSGHKLSASLEKVFLNVCDDDTFVESCFENVFRVVEGDDIALQMGAGAGPVWALVELSDAEGNRLMGDLVHLDAGQMKMLRYDWLSGYPSDIRMDILYFRNGKQYTYNHVYRRKSSVGRVPLQFVRFEDRALPGISYSVALQTVGGVEAVASVFDMATEQLQPNVWPEVKMKDVGVVAPVIKKSTGTYGYYAGSVFGDVVYVSLDGYEAEALYALQGLAAGVELNTVVGYGTVRGVRSRRTKSSGIYGSRASFAESDAMEYAVMTVGLGEEAAAPEVALRSDFATSLAFEPFLYPSEDGVVSFDFKTSDKLSTFVVSVFAHDKNMNNSVVRREMLVTLPVKVSVVQPQYLYVGDRYVLNAAVSNVSEAAVSGDAVVEVYAGGSHEGAEPLARSAVRVDVPVGGVASVPFEMTVPSGVDTLGFKVVFADGQMSDGLFVTVPVYEASQVIREAHSAVLLSGMSEEAVLQELRGRFVSGSSFGAEYSSVSIMDMLRSALPLVVESEDKDAVSQSVAMYVNMLAAGLRAADGEDVRPYVEAAMNAVSALLECAGEDGGFAWMEGMKPSPVITAVVLDRYAGLRDRGLLTLVSEILGEDALDAFGEAVTASVEYLDSVCFKDKDRPLWYGSISWWQYLSVRSKYAGVPFDVAQARKNVGASEYRDFKAYVKDCLTPGKDDQWTTSAVLAKARVLQILNALSASEAGVDLAKAWGISVGKTAKMRKSMKRELESLKEYAVEHPSGGMYYPNAVLPWRGLLESEAYAHAMLCDLFRDLSSDPEMGEGLAELADGIRIWIMLQKETQEWSSDPGFVDAMASVYDGSAAVKDTRVLVLSKNFLKPFHEVRETGNGMKVSVSYFRGGEELHEGDTLHVGDEITAKYALWSAENRSFVRLSVPRAACMRPADQLSGWTWGWFKPLSYGFLTVSPYSYREVRADRTLYWIDVFPEENTSIEEELFVTQEGVFTSPVAEIESLYAPHYRANDSYHGSVVSARKVQLDL